MEQRAILHRWNGEAWQSHGAARVQATTQAQTAYMRTPVPWATTEPIPRPDSHTMKALVQPNTIVWLQGG